MGNQTSQTNYTSLNKFTFVESNKWIQIIPSSNIKPTPRADHSIFYYKNGIFVIFGGNVEQKFNDIYKFDTHSLEWTKLDVSGTIPSSRVGHSSVVYNNSLFIFGGLPESIYRKNDVYSLSLEKLKWKLIIKETKERLGNPIPIGRQYHSANVWKDKMIIFGGEFRFGGNLNDCFSLDLKFFKWKPLICSGDIPKKRMKHSSVIYGNEMYVFGGIGDHRVRFNDLHVLNLETCHWKSITMMGQIPTKRSSHTACRMGSRMILFGGYDGEYLNDLYEFNFNSHIWKKVNSMNELEPKRCSHASVVHEDILFIFGGHYRTSPFKVVVLNDCFVYKFGNGTFNLNLLKIKYKCDLEFKFKEII